MNNNLLFWLVFIIVIVLLILLRHAKPKWIRKLAASKAKSKSNPKPQVYRPKSEKDCPCCQAALAHSIPASPECQHAPLVPWEQIKGKGGPPKTICTEGYFCSKSSCRYYAISDQTIHALVGYGQQDEKKSIQDLFCQACKTKFSCRKHTPLYRLKTKPDTVDQAMHMLVLGATISMAEEILHVRESTIRTWLARSGEHGRKLHEHFFKNLELTHLQLDELWANVKHDQQDVWLWTVCDAKTKLIPVIQLGPRTLAMAYAVVHELITRLKAGCVPAFSSDGLRHYFSALTAHFGEWVPGEGRKKPVWMVLSDFHYAQVIKMRKRLRVVDVEQRFIWGSPVAYRSHLKAAGLSGNINTAFVERANLTIRQSVSKLARRTWASSQYSSELFEHIYWWLAYYHFSRYHESLRIPLKQPAPRKGRQRPIRYRRCTPAMAAGLTRRHWSVMDLLSYPLL